MDGELMGERPKNPMGVMAAEYRISTLVDSDGIGQVLIEMRGAGDGIRQTWPQRDVLVVALLSHMHCAVPPGAAPDIQTMAKSLAVGLAMAPVRALLEGEHQQMLVPALALAALETGHGQRLWGGWARSPNDQGRIISLVPDYYTQADAVAGSMGDDYENALAEAWARVAAAAAHGRRPAHGDYEFVLRCYESLGRASMQAGERDTGGIH